MWKTYFCKLGLEKQFYEASDKFDVVSTLFSLMALLSAELRYTANEWQRQRNSSNGTALKALSRPYIKLWKLFCDYFPINRVHQNNDGLSDATLKDPILMLSIMID